MRALSPLPCVSSVPWSSTAPTTVFLQSSAVRVQSPYSLPQCCSVHSRPLPVPWPSRALVRPVCAHTTLPCPCFTLPLQLWYAPGVGPTSSLRSGSALQSRRSRPQLQLQSLSHPLRSLRGSGGIRPGWDPGPLPQCLRGDPRGPSPLSGPVHQDQWSHRRLDLSHHSPRQQRR